MCLYDNKNKYNENNSRDLYLFCKKTPQIIQSVKIAFFHMNTRKAENVKVLCKYIVKHVLASYKQGITFHRSLRICPYDQLT